MGILSSPSRRSLSSQSANKGCGVIFLAALVIFVLFGYLGVHNLFGVGGGSSSPPNRGQGAAAAQQPAPAKPKPGAEPAVDGYTPVSIGCTRIVNGRRADATLVVTYTGPGRPDRAVITPQGAFTYASTNGSFRWSAHNLDPNNLYASIRVEGSFLAKSYHVTVAQGGPKVDVAGKITQFKLCGFTQH
jgi:hypothetical protein